MKLFTPARLVLVLFTLAYIIVGTIYLLKEGNTEFIWYVIGLAPLLVVAFWAHVKFDLPLWSLWLISILAALHLAGGAIKVNGDVLYAYVLIPIQNPLGLTFWKYDQLVHPFGGFVIALITYYLIQRASTFPRPALFLLAFLVANGMGALNEVNEFITKVTIPDTNVGGYYNSSLDLCFNAVGAIIGCILGLALFRKKS